MGYINFLIGEKSENGCDPIFKDKYTQYIRISITHILITHSNHYYYHMVASILICFLATLKKGPPKASKH